MTSAASEAPRWDRGTPAAAWRSAGRQLVGWRTAKSSVSCLHVPQTAGDQLTIRRISANDKLQSRLRLGGRFDVFGAARKVTAEEIRCLTGEAEECSLPTQGPPQEMDEASL